MSGILLKIIYLSGILLRLLLGQVLLNRETRKLLVRLEDGLARLDHHLCLEMSPQNNASQPNYCKSTTIFITILRSYMITIRAQLEAIRPNSDRLLASDTSGRVAGVILTLRCVVINNHQLRYLCNVSLCSRARAEDKEDFFSRYFAPWNGIPEVRANTIFVK